MTTGVETSTGVGMIPAAVMQRAIRSWAQRHSGTWYPRHEADLQSWLTEAPEHRAAYEKVARAWDAAGELQGHPLSQQGASDTQSLPPGEQLHPHAQPVQPGEPLRPHAQPLRPREQRSHFTPRTLALAACLALLTFAGTFPFWSPTLHGWIHGGSTPNVHLLTLKGQPKPFVLDDGTHVLLDADSELIAQIGHTARRVTLLRGEARFSVLHDSSRPFEVTAGAGRIQDVGTTFDIETLTDATRVSVLEGRVAVLTARGQTQLVAGQAGGYDKAGELTPVSSFNPTTTPGLEGTSHFERETLADVLERLARHHPVTFLFEDPHLRKLRVSGTFRTDDLNLFLRTLSAALPIESQYVAPGEIEISSQSPRSNRDLPSDGRTPTPH